jgi:16S rRNA (guanine1516-N2)-methyltransferase
MPQGLPAATANLQQLAASSAPDLQVSSTDQGVEIELAGMRFRHSFVSGPIVERAHQSAQLLLRACNSKQRNIHRILDLTAGWGVDGFILACHGRQVTLVEHSPLIHAIVDQSLAQLRGTAGKASIARRLALVESDAATYLRGPGAAGSFDCIYLDPMFDAHKSGAKPAKEMQILQALTVNSNIEECLELALARAGKRVVVKRSAKAPTLGDLKPDLVQRAKSVRFDIYLTA